MGVITGMLREHGYEEWDGEKGQMIGCSYDWRLNPAQLERRDKFFTRVNKAACVRLKMTYKGTESSVCWIDDGTDGSSSGCTRKACCSDRIQLGLQNCQGQGMCLPPESSLDVRFPVFPPLLPRKARGRLDGKARRSLRSSRGSLLGRSAIAPSCDGGM